MRLENRHIDQAAAANPSPLGNAVNDTATVLDVPDPALFDGLSLNVACRWAQYFYTKPKNPTKSASLCPHALALYNPFAKRSQFPAGIRFWDLIP